MASRQIITILSRFPLSGQLQNAEPFGAGLINDTYLCTYKQGSDTRKYILQRINEKVFRNPAQVMENIEVVTAHIAGKLRARGVPNPDLIAPALVHTIDGRSFHEDGEGSYWRVFHFIETGEVFDTVRSAPHAYQVGRGLGMFQALVADLSPALLNDTLPGFHHTDGFLAEFDEARRRDRRGRLAEVSAEATFLQARRSLAPLLTDALRRGELPLRVVHNDPKVNNIMIDRRTGEALCMLDLDTAKAGTVLFDFGDCVRSAANPCGEDAPELSSVELDLVLFEAIAKGYLEEAGSFLTQRERMLLPLSVKVITFELGLRFLADYLRGDTYFRISHPTHNLHRARVQFRLLESIEAQEEKMNGLIETLTRR